MEELLSGRNEDVHTASINGEAYRMCWSRRQNLEYLLGDRESVYFASTKIDPDGSVTITRLEDKSFEIEHRNRGIPSTYHVSDLGDMTEEETPREFPDNAIECALKIKEAMETAYAGAA